MTKIVLPPNKTPAAKAPAAAPKANAPTPPTVAADPVVEEAINTSEAAVVAPEAAVVAPPVVAPAKSKRILLKATRYDIVDPTSGIRVLKQHMTEVASITPWLRSQITKGLIERID